MNVRNLNMRTIATLNSKESIEITDEVKNIENLPSPNPPKVINFFVSGHNGIMKGSAEANVTIEIIEADHIIANVLTSSKGTFVVKLPKPCKGKTLYFLFTKDKNGKKSELVKHLVEIK